MTNDLPAKNPIVEIYEVWNSPLSAPVALDAIARSFSRSSAKVEQAGNAVSIRTGSNWRYRLLGNALSGSTALPVALTVTVTSLRDGSELEAHAYDTFGWRITDETFFGAKESFEQRLRELLTSAAKAAEAVNGTAGAI
ncbi:hypothetical protein [Arthrobacter pityocampae]|uniref:hypothetical protein n=1 Tax=Arthrobacter pityocampae TaxID=547334 RepID=UPI003736835F